MTVKTDLATAVGTRRRAFLRIAGHQPALWQRVSDPGGDDATPYGIKHPLDTDVIACWRMNAATGAAEPDASGNGHTAADNYSNCPSVAGKFGTAKRVGPQTFPYYFYVVTRHADLEPAASVTGAAWFYIETAEPSTPGNAFIFGKEHALLDSYMLRTGTYNGLYTIACTVLEDNGGAGSQLHCQALDSDHVLSVGYHHAGFTYNGATSTLSLYLDGKVIETTVGSHSTLKYNTDNFQISDHASSMDGWQDDTALYSGVKSAEWFSGVYKNGLNCLRLKNEWSHSLDLSSMVVKGSNMTFVLDDIDDPDDTGKSYFGKLFAPGRFDSSSSKSTFLRRKSTGFASRQLDANATTINVVKTDDYDNMDAAGEAHVGQETFSYTSKGTDAAGDHGETLGTFLGVTKGLYPAFLDPRGASEESFGYTYEYPPNDAALTAGTIEGAQIVSDVPFSWLGRAVGLYMTTWDDANSQWHSEDDAELVWAGRIADSIIYDPREGWQLQCRSILDDLDKKIGADFPQANGRLVNLNGELGRKFVITWQGTGGLPSDNVMYAYCEVEVAKGYYTLYALGNAMKAILDDSANWVTVTGAGAPSPFPWWFLIGPYGGVGRGYFSANCTATHAATYAGTVFVIWPSLPYDTVGTVAYNDPKRFMGTHSPCHALQALGFDLTSPIQLTFDDQGEAEIYSEKSYPNYQPTHLAFNGSLMLVRETQSNGLWDTQGDRATDLAFVMADDAKPYGIGNKQKGRYYAAYTGQETTTKSFFANYAATLTVVATELTLAGGNDQVAHFNTVDRYGFVGSDDPEDIETYGSSYDTGNGHGYGVQNVYIPSPRSATGAVNGPFEMLLWSLTSTGVNSYNNLWDTAPAEVGIAFPFALIDYASFLDADKVVKAAYSVASRRGFTLVKEATAWSELFRREAQLFGYTLAWDNGKIRIKSVYSPELQSRSITLNESNSFEIDDYPSVKMDIGTVINTRKYVVNHDIHTDKPDKFTVKDVASINGMGGTTKEMTIDHPGVRGARGIMYDDLLFLAHHQAHFTRFPWQQITRGLAPTLLNKVFVGDIVTVVYNTGFQDPFGTGDRDINALALVLNVSWNYSDCVGNCDLLIYSRYDALQVTPWAPAALVDITAGSAGWDTANDRLTLVGLEYGIAGDPDDGSAFAAGDKLKVYERNHGVSDLSATAATTGPFSITVGASGYDAVNNYLYVDAASATALDADFETDGSVEYVIEFEAYGTIVTAQESLGLWQAHKTTHQLDSADDPQRWG